MDCNKRDFAAKSQRIVHVFERELGRAGYSCDQLPSVFRRPAGLRTSSVEAFESLAGLKGAAEVLAALSIFARQSGLEQLDDFAVSCLPSSRSPSFSPLRTSVISVGWVEVFVVALDRQRGGLAGVDVWADPGDPLDWVDDVNEIVTQRSSLNGGGVQISIPGNIALKVLMSPELGATVKRRIVSVRSRTKRARRNDWHNEYLWRVVQSASTSSKLIENESNPGPSAEEQKWDVTGEDSIRTVLQRTRQSAFRKKLFEQENPRCEICGITLREVLEAAHIIPHSQGGAASSENGRLLCANHHRAFDANLYKWNGHSFEWCGLGEEPSLGHGG